MNAIEITDISKTFHDFALKPLSFQVKKGFVTGLIGPNGAGKSTLIKMMLDIIKPDSGSIRFFGQAFNEHRREANQRIGYVADTSHYYEHLSLKKMKQIIAPFYENWNEDTYQHYIRLFELPEKKAIGKLSKGMKMKFSLVIALSHHPDLLIMDEPTAGLDPIFRRELLELLSNLIQDENKTVLFSTHITADLDRIADYIAFIHRGHLVFNKERNEIEENYALIKGPAHLLDRDTRQLFIGLRETGVGFKGLVDDRRKASELFGQHAIVERATLEDIMYYTVKGEEVHA